MNQDQGRIPPNSLDYEEVVLGALLLEKEALHKTGKLTPDMFYSEANGFVFEAIMNLRDSGAAVDMVTVALELKKRNRLESVGGAHYVTTLTGKVASAGHMEEHIIRIIDAFVKRKIISHFSKIIDEAYSDSKDCEEIFNMSSSLEISTHLKGSYDAKPMKQIAIEALEKIKNEVAMVANGEEIGIPAVLPSLAKKIGHFKNSWIIIIAGRPGMGKTQLALFFAKKISQAGFRPAFFSLEMSNMSLVERLFLAETGIDSERMLKRELDSYDLEALENAANDLGKYDLYIDDTAENSLDTIKSKAIELKRKGKCDVIFLDYLQITNMDKMRGKDTNEKTAEAMRVARSIGKELNIPVIILSQLNRDVEKRAGAEGKRPQLADLKNSGSIEQDADLILFPFRPEYYKILEDESGNSLRDTMELIIAKFRHGATGSVRLKYNETLTDFTDSNQVQLPESTNVNFNFHESQPYKRDSDEDLQIFPDKPFE
jgi:replicative DNA helicase